MSDDLLISEGGKEWMPVPFWVNWFFHIGRHLAVTTDAPHALILIAMPCDSAAAGFVAVGAMARRLSVPGANDLEACGRWMHDRFQRGESVLYRYRTPQSKSYRGSFTITNWSPDRMVTFTRTSDNSAVTTPIYNLGDWHEEGKPLARVVQSGDGLGHILLYGHLAGDQYEILPQQLGQTESCLCLAAHVQGSENTRNRLSNVRLRANSDSATIAELTSASPWNEAKVSRMILCERNGNLDRELVAPKLLVADGIKALMKVSDDERFAGSHAVGVFDSVQELDQIKELNMWVKDRRQHYATKALTDVEALVGEIPRGVSMHWFERD